MAPLNKEQDWSDTFIKIRSKEGIFSKKEWINWGYLCGSELTEFAKIGEIFSEPYAIGLDEELTSVIGQCTSEPNVFDVFCYYNVKNKHVCEQMAQKKWK